MTKFVELKIMQNRDCRRWLLNTSGDFTTKSAFNLIRHSKNADKAFKLIWVAHILKKIYVFAWKLLCSSVPTDDRVQGCNIPLTSKCCCCASPKTETLEHLFFEGDLANRVWSFFIQACDVAWFRIHTFKFVVKFWYRQASKGSQKGLLLSAIPLFVVWEVWLERNRKKFENCLGSAFNIIFEVRRCV